MTETCAEDANLPQSSRVDPSTSSFVPATPPTPSSPPSRPNRSALRPATRSFASASDLSDTATLVDNHMATSVLHRPSFASLSGLLDSMHAELGPFPPSPALDTPRALPPMPESPFALDSDTSSTSSHPIPAKPKLSRREHALMELLSSERSYASDLALTRDIHIPLALGHTSPFPTTPPSSGSSSRTLSTASGSSTASDPGPAMTREDARIIFGNIAELAVFADAFSERLEEALGGVIEGGQGDDRIGTLFLEIIPQMEPLYKTYITKHPTALGHLNSLPPTPALQAYLTYTQTVAASLSHAWDLPSLLIKPVQRLLKYPLLLGTIIEETPDAHPDKANLRAAKELMEAVAREVNEGRRRYEVVKEVLTGKPPAPADVAKAKEKGKKAKGTKPGVYVPVGLAAAVAIGKMKNLNLKSQRPQEGNEEAEVCERQEAEMKATVGFMKEFAKDALEWAGGVRETMRGLHGWAVGFARVIGLQDDQESEAFDAFLEVVNKQLLPLGEELEGAVEERVLIQLAKLVKATENPFRLLEALHTLEPLHYGLLNMNFAKNRPPPALLEASQSYVALRAQLVHELPEFVLLLHKGVVAIMKQFAIWQAEFWGDVHMKWGELWEALRIEDEANGGAQETVRVWWGRFAEVEMDLNTLRIVSRAKLHEDPRDRLNRPSRMRPVPVPVSQLDAFNTTSRSPPRVAATSIIAALDPSHAPRSPAMGKSPSSSSVSTSPKTSRLGQGQLQTPSPWTEFAAARDTLALKKKVSRESVAARSSISSSGGSSGIHLGFGPAGELGGLPSALYRSGSGSRTRSMPVAPRKNSGASSLARSYEKPAHLSMPPPSAMPPSFAGAPKSPSVAAYEAGMLGANSLGALSPDREERGRRHKPGFRRKLSGTLESMRPGSSGGRDKDKDKTKEREREEEERRKASRSRRRGSGASQYHAQAQGHDRSTSAPALPYMCHVVHPCDPPRGVQYRGLPFRQLRVGDVVEVLEEHGHPKTHSDLPLYVDDGVDCLMLVRDQEDVVGWALASFLVPMA